MITELYLRNLMVKYAHKQAENLQNPRKIKTVPYYDKLLNMSSKFNKTWYELGLLAELYKQHCLIIFLISFGILFGIGIGFF
jgi:hypothetical protein